MTHNAENLKDRTAKGLLWGGLNNGLQQLLNLFFGIFLARLLSADDYGMVGMLSIFSLIAGSLQESGFTSSLAVRKEAGHREYNAVFWFSTGVSALLYLLLFCCAPLIAQFYGVEELTPLARYAFLGFFIASLGVAHNAYLFRHLMVKQKAIATLTGLVVSGTVGILLAWNGFAYWGIATQSIVYVAVVNLCYWYFTPWHPTFSFSFAPIREMLPFSSKLLLTNLFNILNNNLLTVILGRFFHQREVGYFTQANKWNQMGHSTVTGMVNSVAQPVLAGVSDDLERQRRVFRKMLRFTAFLAFPAMFGLSLVAPELITLTITEKWLPSAQLLQLLCIGGAFVPIATLYSNLVLSRKQSNLYMYVTVAQCIVQLTALLLFHAQGIHTLVTVYVGINILWTLVWQVVTGRMLQLTPWMALRDTLPFAATALVAMVATYHATLYLHATLPLFLAKIVLAALIYLGVLWRFKSETLRESWQYLRKKR
jgi:O-antigen/teichoic acid export membrane protein